MTIESAFTHFVEPMRRRFIVSQGLNQEDFLTDLAERLATYTPHQLRLAADWFSDNRESRTFPSLAECRKACERFLERPVAAIAKGAVQQDRRKQQAEKRHIACELCVCEMGEQADREGWLVALIEFAEDRGRLPMGLEINHVQDVALKSERGLESNRGGPLYASLCNWRTIMLERARSEVFGPLAEKRRKERKEREHRMPEAAE